MKQPWLKFYPSDWRSDPALRMCSIGARGLWIELLCVMHEAEPRGSLLVNGTPVTDQQLAALAGSTVKEVKGFMTELEVAGVFSREDDGTIFSRRMRRDTERSEEGRKQISKRWKDRSPTDDPNRSPNRLPPNDPITQKLEARSQKEDGDTRASASISEEAFRVADDLRKVWKIDADDTAFSGLPYNVQAWINGGAEVLFIMSKAANLRPKNLSYVNASMMNAIEERKTEPQKPNTGRPHAQTSRAVIDAADRLVERVRSFDAPAPRESELRIGASASPVRAISQG